MDIQSGRMQTPFASFAPSPLLPSRVFLPAQLVICIRANNLFVKFGDLGGGLLPDACLPLCLPLCLPARPRSAAGCIGALLMRDILLTRCIIERHICFAINTHSAAATSTAGQAKGG